MIYETEPSRRSGPGAARFVCFNLQSTTWNFKISHFFLIEDRESYEQFIGGLAKRARFGFN
jgi:hypothetical protein